MLALISRTYERYLRASSRRPWTVLGIIFALSGALLFVGSKIRIEPDLEDLFPENNPAVLQAKAAEETLGRIQELRILIGGPAAGESRDLIRAVAHETGDFLAARPDMKRVEVRRDISFFEKNGLLLLPIEDLQKMQDKVAEAIQQAVKKDLGLDDGFELDDEPEAKPDPGAAEKITLPSIEEIKREYKIEGFNEYFESPDGDVIAVKAYPDFKASNAAKTGELNDALDAYFAAAMQKHPGVSFTVDGDYSQVTKAAKQITGDAAVSGTAALIVIAVLMFVFFRRFRAVLVALAVLLVTAAWTLGFAVIGIGYLNLITSIAFTILFGMSVDYIVHGLARIDDEYRGGRSLEDAVRIGLFGLAAPVFNAMLTTAVTFWALVFFDFRGFSQLGVIAGFGVVFALFAFYFVYPPLTFAMHRVWKQKPRARAAAEPAHEPTTHEGLASAPPVQAWQKKAAYAMLAIIGVLSAGSVFLTRDLHFDPNTARFRPQATDTESALKKAYKKADNKSISPALVITKDLAETERLERYLQANKDKYPLVTEVRSIFSFVPHDVEAKLAIVRETKRKIDNKYGALEGDAKADADRLLAYLDPHDYEVADLPAWVKTLFTDVKGNVGRYVLLSTKGAKSDALEVQKVREQIGTITVPAADGLPEATFTTSASYYISAEAYLVVKREGPLAALLGLGVVLLVVLTEFRRPKELAMIVIPILASFAILLGLMVVVELPLDLFNVIVLPQVFGIGIDTGTHLTHRIKEGGPRVVHNVKHTAYAAGISSLLTGVGFASLLFTSNVGLQGIGWLAVLGIGTAYAVNIVMFTAFLWLGRPLATNPSAVPEVA